MIVYFKGKLVDLDNNESDILEEWTFCRLDKAANKLVFGYNNELYMNFNEKDYPRNIEENDYMNAIIGGLSDKSYIMVDINTLKYKDKIIDMINNYIK